MKRVFLDSSVLFSAAYSSRGHSRDLLIMAARGELTIVISNFVINETQRNLAEIAPKLAFYLDLIVEAIPFEYIRPSKREVMAAAEHVALKDAPIVAAAKKAEVDLLVTLDKQHLLGKPALTKYVGAEIVAPKDAMAFLRDWN